MKSAIIYFSLLVSLSVTLGYTVSSHAGIMTFVIGLVASMIVWFLDEIGLFDVIDTITGYW
jgi:hypothetical protein